MITPHDKVAAVHCRGLTKTYGAGPARVTALRGVDLDVQRGELLMLVGPSGCGKTTLISIFSSIIHYDEGTCEVFDRDLSSLGSEEKERFRRDFIGFVFQMFHLIPALTLLDNVAVPLLINHVPRKTAVRRAGEILEQVGMESRLNSLPGQMSGGQQQRVAIARALVHNPELIVCDEPTSSLDHRTGREIMTILRDIARHAGRTLIIVTHDNRILEFADRIAYMEDGKIVDVKPALEKGRSF
jgi:putative ABC transport system ATP-binding protein